MAPLYTASQNYYEAIVCLRKVLSIEINPKAKAHLLSKIAGNYKKAGNEEECKKATE